MSSYKISNPLPINKTMDVTSSAEKKAYEGKMKEAAKLYERMFLNEMVKAMRNTVSHANLTKPSMAEKIYKDKLYDNYVDQWSQSGGVGLSDIIYQQIVERYSPYHRNQVAPPQGPIEIEPKRAFKIKPDQLQKKETGWIFHIDKNQKIKAPWSAEVSQVIKAENNQNLVVLSNDNGLETKIGFVGELENLSLGQKLQAGQVIGFSANKESSLSWTVG